MPEEKIKYITATCTPLNAQEINLYVKNLSRKKEII